MHSDRVSKTHARTCRHMGPIAAGPLIGVASRHWPAAIIGFVLGTMDLLNVWAVEKYVQKVIRRFQNSLLKPIPRVLLNIAALAWAFFPLRPRDALAPRPIQPRHPGSMTSLNQEP
jgi:hypothetical protein